MTYDWKYLTEEFINRQEEIFNLENKIRIIFKDKIFLKTFIYFMTIYLRNIVVEIFLKS
jgi:hypothetical protein